MKEIEPDAGDFLSTKRKSRPERSAHAAGIITRTMMTTSMSITSIITTANAAAVTIIIMMIMTMTNTSITSTRMNMVTNTAARTRARS